MQTHRKDISIFCQQICKSIQKYKANFSVQFYLHKACNVHVRVCQFVGGSYCCAPPPMDRLLLNRDAYMEKVQQQQEDHY